MSTQSQPTRLRVNCFSVSLDGYGAGPRQDLQNPLGVGGMSLHEWVFPTRTFQAMHGGDAGGTTGIDEDFAARGAAGLRAWILADSKRRSGRQNYNRPHSIVVRARAGRFNRDGSIPRSLLRGGFIHKQFACSGPL